MTYSDYDESRRHQEKRESGTSRSSDDGDFSAAINRLEKAVQDLVGVTTGQLTDRATSLIDETSKRIESELRMRRANPNEEVKERTDRRRERRRHRHQFRERTEAYSSGVGNLSRDRRHQRISGVCAGLARYMGIETWVMRMGALTGAIFFPVLVVPAYIVATFVIPEDGEEPVRRRRRRRRRRRSRHQYEETHAAMQDESKRSSKPPRDDFIPRRSLRYTQGDLTQAELRLRRIESFVTSNQYELQKELAKIEREEARA